MEHFIKWVLNKPTQIRSFNWEKKWWRWPSFCCVWFISQWASRLFMVLSKFASLFQNISSCPKSFKNKHRPRFSWCCYFQWNLLLPYTYAQRYSCKYVCTLGWAPWNLSCLEFKFDDTRLSHWHLTGHLTPNRTEN